MGIRALLEEEEDIIIVAEAYDGMSLMEKVAEVPSDIIITDIRMPEMDGIEATRNLVALYPDINIIGLSMFDEEQLIIEMLDAGAKGYVIKNGEKEQLLKAIYKVHIENDYYVPFKTTRIEAAIKYKMGNVAGGNAKSIFTKREKEILRLICMEYATKEIATHLNLSIRTVEGFRTNILKKSRSKNTAGIVAYAIKHGLYLP